MPLSKTQLAKLDKMKISPQRKAGMVRHAQIKRSKIHNDEMLKNIAKGDDVPTAHTKAYKKVGL